MPPRCPNSSTGGGATHEHKKNPSLSINMLIKSTIFAVFQPFFMFFGQNSQNEHYFSVSLELSSKSPYFTEFFKPQHSTSLKENAKTKTSTLDLTHFVQFFPNLVTFTRYRVANLTCRIPEKDGLDFDEKPPKSRKID